MGWLPDLHRGALEPLGVLGPGLPTDRFSAGGGLDNEAKVNCRYAVSGSRPGLGAVESRWHSGGKEEGKIHTIFGATVDTITLYLYEMTL